MSKIDVLRKIIDECDVSLKENFLRRMDASNQIAEHKIENGMKIFDPNREKFVLNNVTAGLSGSSAEYAAALWRNMLRMSREYQYEIYTEKNEKTGLSYEDDLVSELPFGDFCCSSAIPALDISQYPFLGAPIPVVNEDAVYQELEKNTVTYGIVKIPHMYATEALYEKLVQRKLYVNMMIPLESGHVLVIFSKNLVCNKENSVTSVSFHFPDRSGELAHYLSMLADRKINVDFIRLICDETNKKNIVQLDMAGSLDNKQVKAVLMQFADESPFAKLVGSRKPIKW